MMTAKEFEKSLKASFKKSLLTELRELSESYESPTYERILKHLKEEAKKGKRKTTASNSNMSLLDADKLREEGLIVSYVADFKDGDYWIISW